MFEFRKTGHRQRQTVLLRALGYSTSQLLEEYYDKETVHIERGAEGELKFFRAIDMDLLTGQRAAADILDPKDGSVVVKKGRKFTKLQVKRMKAAGIDRLPVEREELAGKYAAEDVFDESTGEVLVECNQVLDDAKVTAICEAGLTEFHTLYIDNFNVGSFLRDTLEKDSITAPEDAVMEIYRRLRPGDPPTQETAQNLFESLFFRPDRYDLSAVGRLKLNHKFGIDEGDLQTLSRRDIIETVRYLIELRNGRGQTDDIDHLGNRRVRAVGELMENQYRIGLVRMERAIKERMSLQEIETLMPHDLIN